MGQPDMCVFCMTTIERNNRANLILLTLTLVLMHAYGCWGTCSACRGDGETVTHALLVDEAICSRQAYRRPGSRTCELRGDKLDHAAAVRWVAEQKNRALGDPNGVRRVDGCVCVQPPGPYLPDIRVAGSGHEGAVRYIRRGCGVVAIGGLAGRLVWVWLRQHRYRAKDLRGGSAEDTRDRVDRAVVGI